MRARGVWRVGRSHLVSYCMYLIRVCASQSPPNPSFRVSNSYPRAQIGCHFSREPSMGATHPTRDHGKSRPARLPETSQRVGLGAPRRASIGVACVPPPMPATGLPPSSSVSRGAVPGDSGCRQRPPATGPAVTMDSPAAAAAFAVPVAAPPRASVWRARLGPLGGGAATVHHPRTAAAA